MSEKKRERDEEDVVVVEKKDQTLHFQDFAREWQKKGNEAGKYDMKELSKAWVDHVTNANGCNFSWENLWARLDVGLWDDFGSPFYNVSGSTPDFQICTCMESGCFTVYVGGSFSEMPKFGFLAGPTPLMHFFAVLGMANDVVDSINTSTDKPTVGRCKNTIKPYLAFTAVFPKHVKRTDPVVGKFLREFLRLMVSEMKPVVLLRGFC